MPLLCAEIVTLIHHDGKSSTHNQNVQWCCQKSVMDSLSRAGTLTGEMHYRFDWRLKLLWSLSAPSNNFGHNFALSIILYFEIR